MNASSLRFGDDLEAFANHVFGAGLPADVALWLAEAALLYEAPQQALVLLERARLAAPSHPAPLIALYRFHFYGHRLEAARSIAEDALAIARTALGPDFADQPPGEAATRFDAAVRFYLFVLKGLAYLNLRLGHLDEAQLCLRELRRLDPLDHVGGALLAQVLDRHTAQAEGGGDYPVRGWGGRQ